MSTHSTKEEEEREMGEGDKTSGGGGEIIILMKKIVATMLSTVNCLSLHRLKHHYLCQFSNCSQTRHTQPVDHQ